jgi:hypothetical protein
VPRDMVVDTGTHLQATIDEGRRQLQALVRRPAHLWCPRPDGVHNNEVRVASRKDRSIDLHCLAHQPPDLWSREVPARGAMKEVERAVIAIEKCRTKVSICEMLQTILNG